MEERTLVLPPGALEAAEERAKELKAIKASEKKPKKLIPLNNWVLIRKQLKEVTESEGGIIDPALGNEKSDVGIVVATALGLVDSRGLPLDVKVGDMVLFTHFSLTIDGVGELTQDPLLQTVRGEEIYFKIVDDDEAECT